MNRADLRALTEDALVALVNRGLVKRARRESTAVGIEVSDDGTVTASYPDGTASVLPPATGLDGGTCSCGAPGVCRHLLAAVLAYQRTQEPETPADSAGGRQEEPGGQAVTWSPGHVTDEELTAWFGARALATARRMREAGLSARVHREPLSVELPAATVRFLVPGDLGYIDCDARESARPALVVLAVWVFREADRIAPETRDTVVDFGASGVGDLSSTASVVNDLLLDGVATAGPVLTAALRRERAALDRAGLRWPVAVLGELVEQLDAYERRAAAHEPVRVADLIAESHARIRVPPSAQSLGADEPAETPLKQVRLVALGARAGRSEEEDTADVYLAHPGSGTVLVLKQRWERRPGSPPVGARRVAGTTLAALARSNVVSEAAVRSAGRTVRFGGGGLSRTAVTPVGDAWDDLAVTDVAALLADLAAAPPRLVRARVAAEHMRVLPVVEVLDTDYDPGAQRFEAVVGTPDGARVTISLTHRPDAPAALDTLARLLAEGPTAVTGTVRRARGTLVLDPVAVRTATGVGVLDLEEPDATTLVPAGTPELDPLTGVLDAGLSVLAEAAHRGLRHLPPTLADRVSDVAARCDRVGLAGCGAVLRAWGARAEPAAWLAAQIRLTVAAELR